MTITAHPGLSLESVMARGVRMLTLLAGCDPCGYVEHGRSPNLYAGMALDALFRLRRGTDPAMKFVRVGSYW